MGDSKVHAIVVTHRGAAFLPDCLRALEAEAGRAAPGSLEIVVVDNASSDGTESLLRADFPDVTMLRLPENVGYGGGNNVRPAPAAHPGGRFGGLLHDDRQVRTGFFAGVLRGATLHPEAGLL